MVGAGWRVPGADVHPSIVPKSASTAAAIKREKLNKSIPADEPAYALFRHSRFPSSGTPLALRSGKPGNGAHKKGKSEQKPRSALAKKP